MDSSDDDRQSDSEMEEVKSDNEVQGREQRLEARIIEQEQIIGHLEWEKQELMRGTSTDQGLMYTQAQLDRKLADQARVALYTIEKYGSQADEYKRSHERVVDRNEKQTDVILKTRHERNQARAEVTQLRHEKDLLRHELAVARDATYAAYYDGQKAAKLQLIKQKKEIQKQEKKIRKLQEKLSKLQGASTSKNPEDEDYDPTEPSSSSSSSSDND